MFVRGESKGQKLPSEYCNVTNLCKCAGLPYAVKKLILPPLYKWVRFLSVINIPYVLLEPNGLGSDYSHAISATSRTVCYLV